MARGGRPSLFTRDFWLGDWDGWGGRGPASGAAVLTSTYGQNGNEPILPSLMASTGAAYGGNSIVFGAILARLMLFSEATFKFRNVRDRRIFGDPGLAQLEAPWPNGTTGELLARMVQDVDLAGNAYVWDAGDQLVRLRPDWVTIISRLTADRLGRQYREVVGYHWEPPSGMEQHGDPATFTVDEVAHWSPIPDPWATFRGMSWLTPVLREVQADQAMVTHKIRYLENAATPNLVIKYSQKLGEDTVVRIRDRIQARHGGVGKAFGTLVLDEGAEPVALGNSFEQMAFSTVQAAGENRILIASGVPGIVIGSKEGLMAATYSNYEQAMRRFADLTMRPLWRSVCAALAPLVQVPGGAQLWFDVSDIAALRQGEKERAETMLTRSQALAELVGTGKFDPDSCVAALDSGDMTQLKVAAAAPPPALPTGGLPAALNGNGHPALPAPMIGGQP